MFKVNEIVMITIHYPNGKRSRLVGAISIVQPPSKDGYQRVILRPVNRQKAEEYRSIYCEACGYTYHRADGDSYSDSYGFASNTVHMDTTVILGTEMPPVRWASWYPAPGNPGFDLMC